MNKIYNDKIYYIIKFEYYSEEKWALWFTSDKDGVITENGKIYCFDSERSLKIYCRKMNINSEEEVEEYRIDEIEKWVNTESIEVDCRMILEFWNIVDDISESVKKSIYKRTDISERIYEKLFYGNNLKSINTSGRVYVPKWSDEEFGSFKKYIETSFDIYKKTVIDMILVPESEIL